jgi:hypothetical protein
VPVRVSSFDGHGVCCCGPRRRRPISRIGRIDPLYRQTAVGIGFGLLITIVLASTLSAMVPRASGPGAQELVVVQPVSAAPTTTAVDPSASGVGPTTGSSLAPRASPVAPTPPTTQGQPGGGPDVTGPGGTTPTTPGGMTPSTPGTGTPTVTQPTAAPTTRPTAAPTARPTATPTPRPTPAPTPRPTAAPTPAPTPPPPPDPTPEPTPTPEESCLIQLPPLPPICI